MRVAPGKDIPDVAGKTMFDLLYKARGNLQVKQRERI